MTNEEREGKEEPGGRRITIGRLCVCTGGLEDGQVVYVAGAKTSSGRARGGEREEESASGLTRGLDGCLVMGGLVRAEGGAIN